MSADMIGDRMTERMTDGRRSALMKSAGQWPLSPCIRHAQSVKELRLRRVFPAQCVSLTRSPSL